MKRRTIYSFVISYLTLEVRYWYYHDKYYTSKDSAYRAMRRERSRQTRRFPHRTAWTSHLTTRTLIDS